MALEQGRRSNREGGSQVKTHIRNRRRVILSYEEGSTIAP
jgi:hypothetical protein